MLQILRIATRQSALALWQANHVRNALIEAQPSLEIQIIGFTTEGDRNQRSPLREIGGKGLFIKELEQALLSGTADIAVHSMKDVPSELPPGLQIGAICERADPRDALVSKTNKGLSSLVDGSRIGTSSMRRRLQLQASFSSFEYADLRGNVDTRLSKLDAGYYDAIVLAAAGLHRLGMGQRISERISTDLCLPAAGQGAVGIECRSDDVRVKETIASVNHEITALCVSCEREVTLRLGANCNLPVAVYASLHGDEIYLRSFVSDESGTKTFRRSGKGLRQDSLKIAQEVTEGLLTDGAAEVLGESG